jgi:hypothetical protein
LKKPVDVDRSHALGKSDVLLGLQSLVPEENHAVLVECSSNIRDCFCVKRVRQIDAQKLCAERTRCQVLP